MPLSPSRCFSTTCPLSQQPRPTFENETDIVTVPCNVLASYDRVESTIERREHEPVENEPLFVDELRFVDGEPIVEK